jgi:ribosomal protein S13
MKSKSKFIFSEYGVKRFHNYRFFKKAGVNTNKNLNFLKNNLLNGFDHYLFQCKKNKWSLDSTKENILFLKAIRSYKGSRH